MNSRNHLQIIKNENKNIHFFTGEHEQQELSSRSSSSNQQQNQTHSSSSDSSLCTAVAPSSNAPVSNIIDISRSSDELPAQPILVSYPLNKQNRSFLSQWFAKFSWLEYSEQTDSAYCYYCRHFSTGININNRVINFSLIRRVLFQHSVPFLSDFYLLHCMIFFFHYV